MVLAAMSKSASPQSAAPPTIVLRGLQAGDLGWVVQQHGEIYAREYGWNQAFEGLVADVVAKYQRNLQPEWERAWIAEVNGLKAGSVFVVRKSKTVAQLRLLILTPQARGLGLGARLTDEVIAFARAKGYKKLVLWTNQCLTAARAIYGKRNFKLTHSETHEGYGSPQVGETWELRL
jgi:GNAT superfamily N-acetyltransferase